MNGDVPKPGGIIKAAREIKGMTRAELAKAADIAVRTITEIENNKRYPTVDDLYKIVNILNFSTDYIFWPEKVTRTLERDMLIREFQQCDEKDQAAIIEIAQAYVQAAQNRNNTQD